jgi:hypothetical protein
MADIGASVEAFRTDGASSGIVGASVKACRADETYTDIGACVEACRADGASIEM